jgi:hypothetical protein
MRYRRYIPNKSNLKSRCLQRPESGFPTCPRSFYQHFHRSHTLFHRFAGRILSGELGRKRGRLSGALKTLGAGGRPRHYIAFKISYGNYGIVERSLYVGHPSRDILLFFFLTNRTPFWHLFLPVKNSSEELS